MGHTSLGKVTYTDKSIDGRIASAIGQERTFAELESTPNHERLDCRNTTGVWSDSISIPGFPQPLSKNALSGATFDRKRPLTTITLPASFSKLGLSRSRPRTENSDESGGVSSLARSGSIRQIESGSIDRYPSDAQVNQKPWKVTPQSSPPTIWRSVPFSVHACLRARRRR